QAAGNPPLQFSLARSVRSGRPACRHVSLSTAHVLLVDLLHPLRWPGVNRLPHFRSSPRRITERRLATNISCMGQESYYRNNEAYAEHLAAWNPALYAKYADTLKPDQPGARALDVGCGVGQVVARLNEAGFEAHGVDVSQPNIERAQKVCPRCQLYDGRKLPFADGHFLSAGALNVLEHVDEPEAFIRELVRVVAPGGKVVLSSPNFFRVFGFRDYHPRMRGIGNKLRN